MNGARGDRSGLVKGLRRFASALVVLVLLVARPAVAEDVRVPIDLEAQLLSKVAAYDRNFQARAGDRARVMLVQQPGNDDSARIVAQMQTALSQISAIGGLPHEETIVSWSSAQALAQQIQSQHVAVVFFTSGIAGEMDAVRSALDGVNVLSVAAVADYVPRGIVLGFDLVEGKPKLVVNLAQARRQNVAFTAEVLKIMKVYQ